MKFGICAATGIVGGAVAALFGGWDAGMLTLVIFMAIDYVSGIIVAGVFHKSKKTESGGLQSLVGFKGLAKKVMVLLIVAVAYRLDLTVGSSYIKDAAVIGFSANEVISIVENAGLMGIPMPEAITKAIDILSEKGEAKK